MKRGTRKTVRTQEHKLSLESDINSPNNAVGALSDNVLDIILLGDIEGDLPRIALIWCTRHFESLRTLCSMFKKDFSNQMLQCDTRSFQRRIIVVVDYLSLKMEV